jgi:aminoglycoside phosphotransferase (APT) family kinase protein
MEPRSDPRLEAAIGAIGEWRGRDLGVTPVSIGRDEQHLLIEADGELFMLRLASAASERPGLDATGELEVLFAAASAGVAPQVVAALPQLGCLVTRFAAGRRLTPVDLADHAVLASVVGSARALHACPAPAVPRSVFREARDLHRAALARGVTMPASEPAATEAMRRVEAAVGEVPVTTTACHGDLTRASLLLEGEQIWIVDYRWAGAGDPFEDLASLAAHLDLDGERCDDLLALYFGGANDEHRTRLDLMRPAAEYLAAMRELGRAASPSPASIEVAEGHLVRMMQGVPAT